MKTYLRSAILGLTLAIGGIVNAHALTTYVGSWNVYHPDAPTWSGSPPNGPLAYTGQEAAALLFGGLPSDYVISTISMDVADINHSAWYDVIGHGGVIFAEDHSSKYLGLYYGPTSGYTGALDGAASAFVRDNLNNRGAINYAFRVTNTGGAGVPDAGNTFLLLSAGLGGLLVVRKRLKR